MLSRMNELLVLFVSAVVGTVVSTVIGLNYAEFYKSTEKFAAMARCGRGVVLNLKATLLQT